ncbi:MAG: peptidoglycan editing factor PgeF [Pseudonocardiales bacterium]|nr:MAG: peptidoglycan editing factor PgeF [Pseudonocardiales bacterium]
MHRIRRVITTRVGGVSAPPYDSFNLGRGSGDEPAAVSANRARLAASLRLPEDRLVWMRQVHGATVHTVDGPRAAPLPQGDGLVTTERGLALVALAADCVPVLLADATAGVVGAAHAGRSGAAAGVAVAAVHAMMALGADPAGIDVLLGPAVCGRCYEVPADLQAEVEAALPGSATTTSRGTPGLDLRAGLARQLQAAGVGAVVVDPACTVEDTRFFSHRRDGVTGRFAGLVWLA